MFFQDWKIVYPQIILNRHGVCKNTHGNSNCGGYLPNSTGVLPEFDHGRLAKMTIYEIISLAINLAILILEALSYLKNKKS